MPVWAGQITHRTHLFALARIRRGRAGIRRRFARRRRDREPVGRDRSFGEGDPRRLCGRRDAPGRGVVSHSGRRGRTGSTPRFARRDRSRCAHMRVDVVDTVALAHLRVLLLLIALPPPRSARRIAVVDLALVLAVDASGSVDQVRFELQKQGYVAAFRHPRVIGAIQSGPTQSIAVIMMQWTGPALQVTAVPWTKISDAASANAFADAIARHRVRCSAAARRSRARSIPSMALLFDNPYQRDAARDRHLRRRLEQSRALGQSGARRGGRGRASASTACRSSRSSPISTATYKAERDRRPGRVRDCREGFRDVRRGDPEEAHRGDCRREAGELAQISSAD